MAIIAVDCDEVLVETMYGFIAFAKEQHNHDRVYEKFHSYLVSNNEQANVTPEEVMQLFNGYYASSYAENVQAISGAFDQLTKRKSQGHRLIVVTARNENRRAITEQQITLHYPDIFDEVIYAHHFTENHIPKSEICHAIGAQYFIEDNMDNALEVAECGGTKIFLLERPRNRQREEKHPDIQRVLHRQEIEIP